MKIKLLVAAALLAMVSTSGFSLDIVNGKLISHKEWASNKQIKLSFKDAKITNKFASAVRSDTFHSINVRDLLFLPIATAGVATPIEGTADIQIRNKTITPHNYTIHTTICTNDTTQNQTCGNSEDVITLDSFGSIAFTKTGQLEVTYNNPGNYYVYVSTWIQMDDSEVYYSTYTDDTISVLAAEKA